MRIPRGSGKNFEDRTAISPVAQRRAEWLADQPTSQGSLGFTEKLMQQLGGMSTEDLYLLRAKLFGKTPMPDFNRQPPMTGLQRLLGR